MKWKIRSTLRVLAPPLGILNLLGASLLSEIIFLVIKCNESKPFPKRRFHGKKSLSAPRFEPTTFRLSWDLVIVASPILMWLNFRAVPSILLFLLVGYVLRLPRVDRLHARAEPLRRRSRDRIAHHHAQPRHQLQRGEVGQRGHRRGRTLGPLWRRQPQGHQGHEGSVLGCRWWHHVPDS